MGPKGQLRVARDGRMAVDTCSPSDHNGAMTQMFRAAAAVSLMIVACAPLRSAPRENSGWEPQPAPAAAPAPTSEAVPIVGARPVHAVAPGETLYRIAQYYDTTVEELLELNPKIEPRDLPVGYPLYLPEGKPEFREVREQEQR